MVPVVLHKKEMEWENVTFQDVGLMGNSLKGTTHTSALLGSLSHHLAAIITIMGTIMEEHAPYSGISHPISGHGAHTYLKHANFLCVTSQTMTSIQNVQSICFTSGVMSHLNTIHRGRAHSMQITHHAI